MKTLGENIFNAPKEEVYDDGKEVHDKFVLRTRNHLNQLESQISGKKTADVFGSKEEIQSLFSKEGLYIPNDLAHFLPEMWHDVDIIADYVLQKALGDIPQVIEGNIDLESLNTNRVKVAIFNDLLRSSFSYLDFFSGENEGMSIIDNLFVEEEISSWGKGMNSLMGGNGSLLDRLYSSSMGSMDVDKGPRSLESLIMQLRYPYESIIGNNVRKIKKAKDTYVPNEGDVLRSISRGDYDSDEMGRNVTKEGFKKGRGEVTSINSTYGGELDHIIVGLMEKMNTLTTVVMPQSHRGVKTAMQKSNNRKDFFSNIGKGDFVGQIFGVLWDFVGEVDFNRIKTGGVAEKVLNNVSGSFLRGEAKACYKKFAKLDSKVEDESLLVIDEKKAPYLPFFDKERAVSDQYNESLHIDNFFAAIERKYDLKYIRFSPDRLAMYAKNNNVSLGHGGKGLVYDKKLKAWQVDVNGSRVQKKALMKEFMQAEIVDLGKDKKMVDRIESSSHLHPYFFGKYIKGRHKYHDAFKGEVAGSGIVSDGVIEEVS